MATPVAEKVAERMRELGITSVAWLDGFVLDCAGDMVSVQTPHPLNRMSAIFRHLDRSPDIFQKGLIRATDSSGRSSTVRCFWLVERGGDDG